MKKYCLVFAGIVTVAFPSCKVDTNNENRPWVNVNAAPSEGECGEDTHPTELDACGWATNFDDLVIFAIDAVETIQEPTFLDGEEVSSQSCGRVGSGIRLRGSVESSSKGTVTEAVIFPGGSYSPFPEGSLVEGSRILLPIMRRDDDVFVSNAVPRVDEDDVVETTNFPLACQQTSSLDGKLVTEVITEVANCSNAGSGLDQQDRAIPFEGAACFPAAATTECVGDEDCSGPGAHCDDGVCARD